MTLTAARLPSFFKAIPARNLWTAAGLGLLVFALATRAWWVVAFAAFLGAMAALEGRALVHGETARLAAAVAVALALGFAALATASYAFTADEVCATYDCGSPGPGSILRLAGAGLGAATALTVLGTALYVRSRRQADLVMPGIRLTLLSIAVLCIVVGGSGWGNAGVEIGAIGAGLTAAAIAWRSPGWLRVAILGQAADLMTFGAIWQGGLGELNPLGRVAYDGFHALSGAPAGWTWEAGTGAGLLLIVAKLALVWFLAWSSPHLARYRMPVIVAGTVAGVLGATANIVSRFG